MLILHNYLCIESKSLSPVSHVSLLMRSRLLYLISAEDPRLSVAAGIKTQGLVSPRMMRSGIGRSGMTRSEIVMDGWMDGWM